MSEEDLIHADYRQQIRRHGIVHAWTVRIDDGWSWWHFWVVRASCRPEALEKVNRWAARPEGGGGPGQIFHHAPWARGWHRGLKGYLVYQCGGYDV